MDKVIQKLSESVVSLYSLCSFYTHYTLHDTLSATSYIFHLNIYVISKRHDRLERLSFYSGSIGSISPTLLCHSVKKYKSISIKSFFKFQLDLPILILWTKFAQRKYFRSKTKKANITIEFCIFELD